MRILYAAFAFLILSVSLLLFFHSAWLFVAYIGAFPVALVLLWYFRSRKREEVSPPEETQSIRAHFPKMSLVAGVGTALVLGFCALSPLLFFRSCGSMYKISAPPPDAFKIGQTVTFKLDSGEPEIASEKYDIQPLTHYTVTDIQEIKHGSIPQTQIESLEVFESGKFENTPLQGMHLALRRPLTTVRHESIGLLRSKISFLLPNINLLTRDLRQSGLSESSDLDEFSSRFSVARAGEFNSKVKIELPKNAFLAASPKGELNSLPDKDIVNLSFSEFPGELEVYYLRRARFKIVRDFLSQSSDHDVIVSLLAFLFWPTTMLMVGVFHKSLADSMLSFFGRLFRRKRDKPIGFRGRAPK